ncbi:MAG: hypothetical protein LBQ22_09350 [Bacteroidales bacterium]|jgi:hypothetical protein|nr:hypothetical protein [Bacteroidales bacterium]
MRKILSLYFRPYSIFFSDLIPSIPEENNPATKSSPHKTPYLKLKPYVFEELLTNFED